MRPVPPPSQPSARSTYEKRKENIRPTSGVTPLSSRIKKEGDMPFYCTYAGLLNSRPGVFIRHNALPAESQNGVVSDAYIQGSIQNLWVASGLPREERSRFRKGGLASQSISALLEKTPEVKKRTTGQKLAPDAIYRVMDLLESRHTEIQRDAISTLLSLSLYPANHELLTTVNAHWTVLQMLSSTDLLVIRNAAEVIAHVAANKTVRSALVSHKAVQKLVVFFHECTDGIALTHGLHALCAIAEADAGALLIVENDGLRNLVMLARTRSGEVRQLAAKALASLSRIEGVRPRLVDARTVPVTVRLLRTRDVDLRKSIATIQYNLAASDAIKSKLLQENIIPSLLYCLETADIETQRDALHVMTNLCTRGDVAACVAEEGGALDVFNVVFQLLLRADLAETLAPLRDAVGVILLMSKSEAVGSILAELRSNKPVYHSQVLDAPCPDSDSDGPPGTTNPKTSTSDGAASREKHGDGSEGPASPVMAYSPWIGEEGRDPGLSHLWRRKPRRFGGMAMSIAAVVPAANPLSDGEASAVNAKAQQYRRAKMRWRKAVATFRCANALRENSQLRRAGSRELFRQLEKTLSGSPTSTMARTPEQAGLSRSARLARSQQKIHISDGVDTAEVGLQSYISRTEEIMALDGNVLSSLETDPTHTNDASAHPAARRRLRMSHSPSSAGGVEENNRASVHGGAVLGHSVPPEGTRRRPGSGAGPDGSFSHPSISGRRSSKELWEDSGDEDSGDNLAGLEDDAHTESAPATAGIVGPTRGEPSQALANSDAIDSSIHPFFKHQSSSSARVSVFTRHLASSEKLHGLISQTGGHKTLSPHTRVLSYPSDQLIRNANPSASRVPSSHMRQEDSNTPTAAVPAQPAAEGEESERRANWRRRTSLARSGGMFLKPGRKLSDVSDDGDGDCTDGNCGGKEVSQRGCQEMPGTMISDGGGRKCDGKPGGELTVRQRKKPRKTKSKNKNKLREMHGTADGTPLEGGKEKSRTRVSRAAVGDASPPRNKGKIFSTHRRQRGDSNIRSDDESGQATGLHGSHRRLYAGTGVSSQMLEDVVVEGPAPPAKKESIAAVVMRRRKIALLLARRLAKARPAVLGVRQGLGAPLGTEHVASAAAGLTGVNHRRMSMPCAGPLQAQQASMRPKSARDAPARGDPPSLSCSHKHSVAPDGKSDTDDVKVEGNIRDMLRSLRLERRSRKVRKGACEQDGELNRVLCEYRRRKKKKKKSGKRRRMAGQTGHKGVISGGSASEADDPPPPPQKATTRRKLATSVTTHQEATAMQMSIDVFKSGKQPNAFLPSNVNDHDLQYLSDSAVPPPGHPETRNPPLVQHAITFPLYMTMIVFLLSHVDTRIRRNAASILSNVAGSRVRRNRIRLLESGAMPQLVHTLGSGDFAMKRVTLSAVSHLVELPEGRSELMAIDDSVKTLLSLFRFQDVKLDNLLIKVLLDVSLESEYHVELVFGGTCRELASISERVTNVHDSPVQVLVGRLMINLTSGSSLSQESQHEIDLRICESGIIPLLVKLRKSSEEAVSSTATKALRSLYSQYEKQRLHAEGEGSPPPSPPPQECAANVSASAVPSPATPSTVAAVIPMTGTEADVEAIPSVAKRAERRISNLAAGVLGLSEVT
eukprot:Rmarinus@m.11163